MIVMEHLKYEQLEQGLDHIRRAPADEGILEMIVRRPQVDAREELLEAFLDLDEGLAGDNWRTRGSKKTADGSAHPEMQLNIMSARVVDLVAGSKARWSLAGDQLYIDLDLSAENLPPGTRLAIGSAIIEVTTVPHAGCIKFRDRFGLDALTFVNSPIGKQMRLRGLNARVVQPGTIRVGDVVRKLALMPAAAPGNGSERSRLNTTL